MKSPLVNPKWPVGGWSLWPISLCFESTEEARKLTQSILDSGLLPAKAGGDAAHIALATFYKMDILLTWNCRHIANAFILGRLRRLIEADGHSVPTICTPEELLQQTYEQSDWDK